VSRATQLAALAEEVVGCRRCPRLVEWRERVAAEKVARFADQDYWGKPAPGFGDPDAGALALGLAPAAHGANRTGRNFTGDRSGDFLYAAMHRTGFANQPTSIAADDGLALSGIWVSAVNRCAPPENKPSPVERDNCLPFLAREISLLTELHVIVAMGSFAWDGALRAMAVLGHAVKPKPRFGHGAEAILGSLSIVGCFHPSQQNTFTGKLTPAMLDAVLTRAQNIA